MTRGVLLAATMFLAGDGSASALGPSFDCAKAFEAHDRLICRDPALAKADLELADAYRSALDRLGPDSRARLAKSQRGWIAFIRAVCPLPYPRQNKGVASDAPGCLLGTYRERTAILRTGVRRLGPYTLVRLDAYSVRRLEPDDPGGRYPGGLAVGEVSADWVEPSDPTGEGGEEAVRLNAALLPAGMRFCDAPFSVRPKPVLDTDSMDTSLDTTVVAVTPLIVTTRTDDWSYGHGTPHGWGYTRFGARWRSDARRVAAEELFGADQPWRALIEARVNAETQPYTPWTWGDPWSVTYDMDLRPDGFALNAGYVDGYAGGEKVVVVPWTDLKPFLSESGRRIVGSFRR